MNFYTLRVHFGFMPRDFAQHSGTPPDWTATEPMRQCHDRDQAYFSRNITGHGRHAVVSEPWWQYRQADCGVRLARYFTRAGRAVAAKPEIHRRLHARLIDAHGDPVGYRWALDL